MSQIAEDITRDGCVIVENVLSPEYINRAKVALEEAIEKEVEYHKSRDHKDYGMVLLCALYDRIFVELFENERFLNPFESVLGEGCIVYAYTSSSMPPGKTNYSARIHVDCPRFIPNYVTNIGATILLDDFTLDNGATWYLAGSHNSPDQPSEEEFFAKGKRVVAKAGSVWYFNARLWHAGGMNKTNNWRHAVTVNMCRPYMKQRLDIPRVMKEVDMTGVTPRAMQKLGFLAQVPASYDEFYLPPEQRLFRQRPE